MSTLFDVALVGGGLQNGLIALALRHARPDTRIAVIERGLRVGGNHTWCFHAGDADDASAPWLEPLVVTRWPGYDVAFPAHARRLAAPYACVTSERLAACVDRALAVPGSMLLANTAVLAAEGNRALARGADGATYELEARLVIDARGPDDGPQTGCGWQKFLGQELELASPHGLDRPMLMDATVPQLDGFRFVYVLPLAPTRVLVEDAYFSDEESTRRTCSPVTSMALRFPAAAWWVPIGALVFTLAIAIDTIGHRTIYKRVLRGGEQLVHHITIACGIASCVLLVLAYSYPGAAIPALVFTILSFVYSLIDEAFHWRRYAGGHSDPVEMWSHVGIFVGHGTMMLGWWLFYAAGYPGVRETLASAFG